MGMQMSLRMAMTPAPRTILECGVCGQPIDGEEVKAGMILAKLLGDGLTLRGPFPDKAYAFCPCCFQEVPHSKDLGYRQKAGKLLRIARCRELQRRKDGT